MATWPGGGWDFETVSYNDARRSVQVKDAQGYVATAALDFFGRPTDVQLGDGQTHVHFARDKPGLNVTRSLTPAAAPSGRVTTTVQSVDAGGLRSVRDSAGQELVHVGYDNLGRVIASSDRGSGY